MESNGSHDAPEEIYNLYRSDYDLIFLILVDART